MGVGDMFWAGFNFKLGYMPTCLGDLDNNLGIWVTIMKNVKGKLGPLTHYTFFFKLKSTVSDLVYFVPVFFK